MRNLFPYLRPYRFAIVFIVTFIFIQCLGNLYLPTLMSDIVDYGVLKGNLHYIVTTGLLMLAVSIASVCFSIAASFLSSRTASSFGKVLRREVFAHAQTFSLHEFDELGTSSLITRTTNDITQVQQLVNMMLRMMIMAPLNCIGGILMAVYTDAKLSLILVVMVPVLAAIIALVFTRATKLFRTMQAKIDTLNRVLRENLTGIRVIRSFNRVAYEQDRFDVANFDLTNTTTRVQKIMAVMSPALMLVINLSVIAVIWFGGMRVERGTMQIGSLIAFIQYITQLLFAIMMVSMMFFMIPRASASANRIWAVLQTKPDIVDPVAEDAQASRTEYGQVEFRDVTFRYPGAETPALSHISFVARPGQVTAIIGGTGAGKSTLVNLIPRFYDVNEGVVLVGGVDVRAQTQSALRAKIGYVPQKSVLFSGTIADNIRAGRQDASDEEVRRAAEVAQAIEFIEEMPDGFASYIEQGGRNVSGGQKQRLAIARALAKQAPIYIFDDSFSALDFRTDARLRAALRDEVQEATVIIVAQRVSTVRDAHQIVVLDEGRIAGVGTHDELIDSCQVYREIVASQMAEGESA
ncbi:multidrug ABC transporter ATP-binding protein [Alicyclobacillus hesperidum]|uniref:ATP-binding cassette, subfamily B n=1 Tax=Alicyclobacillus hesperidum TaxID=89784 RepID=A0A1H2S308_9BACL|nr:ABC transporter ATP-binding protein [Alicyclobacillus hesperidum]GLV13363.1 multidrug ABC transporter ATP-binding protein [Alicyclobacillus hesperidum]SDW25936.1 ATP-binding cassette, subfamily B [Alicyclobacillus hesperidum]